MMHGYCSYCMYKTYSQLVSRLCGGRLTGDQTGSSEVTFEPGPLLGGEFIADTHTAG